MAANKPSTSSIDVDGDTRHHDPSQSASPVDGRWAVVVVIAAFIGRAIVSMQSSYMPLLTVEWEKRLGVTPSQVSWASTLANAPRFVIAPVAGALNQKFGCRPIVFVGGFCAMTSILLLSMTNKLWQIFICSCLIGTSMGLVYQGTVIIVSVYFDKWLGRANGLAYSGVGLGIMAGSPLMALLIEVFTWRGALLIVAGLVANLSVTAAVYRPLTWWSKGKRYERKKSTFQGGGYYPSYVYLPSYVVSSGVSELRASFIFTIMGLCSLVGRLTHGFLLDFKLITPTKLYGLTSVLAGCSLYIIVTFGTYPAFVVYAIIFGLSTGAQIPLCPVMTKMYTAPSELASAFGLQSFFTGISQLLVTYLLGLLFDWTNDYRSCFCLAGALLCIGGVIGFLIDPWNRWRHRLDEEIGDGI
ncbi:monocarboxylate transporter 12-like [Strongylocentrotus purpuratus]|uniref:Major facilitator superfamily (MFS) profile domain-containing protein n=1 Tax=Strongylocentrotus purpuratus TaxID=7668 RepID=A0A7M7NNE9_STRPU|nr:monocarboxylate transporter 12-like [Strongylocentrotus purpuratus]